MNRPYEEIAKTVSRAGDRRSRMQSVVDVLWEALKDRGVSWVGFYCHEQGDELVLGPLRNTPACSPIGLHGVCGRSFLRREAIVVRDVRELGEDYVACDARDLSEVVVPLLEQDGSCRAVLDLDSRELGAFGEDDVIGLERVLRAAGLTA